jgi:purine-binding chemotaxis protein CheW
MNAMIVFRIGEEYIGVDITQVREVTEVHKPVMVPKSPDFLLGIVNVRGNVIPVVSLRKRLGLGGDETGNLLLIVEENGRVAGLQVDELFGSKKIVETKINRRAELLATKKEKDFFMGVYEDEEKPVLMLNLGKTLSKEDK